MGENDRERQMREGGEGGRWGGRRLREIGFLTDGAASAAAATETLPPLFSRFPEIAESGSGAERGKRRRVGAVAPSFRLVAAVAASALQ